MKIDAFKLNNRRHAFEIACARGEFSFRYAQADPPPCASDPIVEVFIDPELASEALTYRLRSGEEGFVHIEMVFDYNREPAFMRDLLLYRLSVEAQTRFAESGLSKREASRRLGTSPTQLYRLLDQTNYDKSVDKMLELMSVLGCEVDFSVRKRDA